MAISGSPIRAQRARNARSVFVHSPGSIRVSVAMLLVVGQLTRPPQSRQNSMMIGVGDVFAFVFRVTSLGHGQEHHCCSPSSVFASPSDVDAAFWSSVS